MSVPLHEVQVEAINRIDTEDFSGVMRKVKEDIELHGGECPAEFLDAGVLALKQYYAVALLDPMNEHAVTEAIDPFWHAHILHTRAYAKFCEDVFGQFIHHEPLDQRVASAVDRVAVLYSHTQGVYRKLFQHINPYFYPATVKRGELVCTHYEVSNHLLRGLAIFPAVTRQLVGI